MRTRFHAIDYFSAPSTCVAIRDFQFLYLSPPNICSPSLSFGVENPSLLLDSLVRHELDRFPFEEALADFLSSVIPRFHRLVERENGDGSSRMQIDFLDDREWKDCGSGTDERQHGVHDSEVKVEKITDYNTGSFVPELQEWKSGMTSREGQASVSFEIPGISVSLDKIDVESGICPYQVNKLLCPIQDIQNILVKQECFSDKVGSSATSNKFHQTIKVPCFEVCEIGVELQESSFVDETSCNLLSCLRPHIEDGKMIINATDFVKSIDTSISEHFSTHETLKYSIEEEPFSEDLLFELERFSPNGIICFENHSTMYPVVSDGSFFCLPCSAPIEIVQILDGTSGNVPDIFSLFEPMSKEYFHEQMFKEEVGTMAGFYDSILSSELSLADDLFKYMPIPITSEGKFLKSQLMIMNDMFNILKSHAFSACDEIYLDWHPLLEGVCNHESCSNYLSMAQEISNYRFDTSELKSETDVVMLSDSDNKDDISGDLNQLQVKEALADVHVNNQDIVVPTFEPSVSEILNHEFRESEIERKLLRKNPDKISSVIESLSQSNDLNFFLGVRKAGARMHSKTEASCPNIQDSMITSSSSSMLTSEPCTSLEPIFENIQIHKARLSGYTLGIIDDIKEIYFSNLNECKHLIINGPSPAWKDFDLLSIPKRELVKLIVEKGDRQLTSAMGEKAFVALLSIFAIKQLVYYLCFFGFHIACLYLSNLLHKMDNLAERLQPLQSLLQDAQCKVEELSIESHPSLHVIENILRGVDKITLGFDFRIARGAGECGAILEGIAAYMSHLQWCLNDEKCERPSSPSLVNKASPSSVQKKEVFHDEQIMNLMHFPTSKETTVKGSSAPEVLIIVNTQNHEKNMIMSRRSSYQKILALENGDVQVVERDINLPLDLICSAAVCLVWYEARNVEKTDAAVKLSEVPSFVENIATKILMSLSHSFSGCILIFEGESKFLASIMESSDMLYAAAASLELNLQLFCSHMPDSTDEIILNCIKTIGIIDRGLYPAMPESESISESFLTRIKAIGKYKMPAESICLFNALCRYGEFGESKSVMTDCSSIGSDNSGASLQSNRKRQRYMASSRKPDTLLDESFYVGKVPSNHIGSGAPQTSRPYLSNNFKFHGVPERAQFYIDPEIIDSKLEVNNSKVDNLGRNFFSQHAEHDGKFDLDAIDHSSSFSNEQSSSIPSSGFNIRSSELSKQEVESFYPPGRSSFRQISTFPTSLEINFGEKDRTCFDQNINFIQSVKSKFGLIDKEVSAEKADILHENVSDALDPTCRNRIPYLGDIYLANMNQPSQEQNSRKYKIEFLDRVNKRSRMQQQSPWNTSQIRPGSSKKQISLQKKSPSIIDTFRYRGNKQVNTTSNKCNNFARTKSGPRDLEKKDSALITPTWTPIDKRARQHLFFMRTGNEKQSRLVWRRRDSPSVGGNLRKRKRDEF
ncbi:hypothetical protein HPP92_008323 [Vanilla planifolia]|uniref:Protein SHORTAGE IN CHIASMATA 1 n=1 Tax=Vanilla planifolia TaxID=51239 RepID=A0A835RH27_VANPL|nr:hypothetical protein HPP92_008323 [Vanilla planifolia]